MKPIKSPERILYFATAFAFSIFSLMVFFPGILSNDSFTLWDNAIRGEYDTVKPVALALVMKVFLTMGGGVTRHSLPLFSLVQSVFLWLSVFFFLDKIIPVRSSCVKILVAALGLLPLWVYSVTHWVDVWVVICMLFAVSLLLRDQLGKRDLLLVLVLITLCLLFRHNTLSVVPVFAIWVSIHMVKKNRLLVATGVLSGLVGLNVIINTLLSYIFTVTKVSGMVGFALFNQYLGTLHFVSNSSQKIELLLTQKVIFDNHFGKGKLERALEMYYPAFNGRLVWGNDAILGFKQILDFSPSVIKELPPLVLGAPLSWLKHKRLYLEGFFGIGAPTVYPFQEYNEPWSRIVYYENQPIVQKPISPHLFLEVQRLVSVSMKTPLFWHGTHFLIALIVLVLSFIFAREYFVKVLFLFLMSCFYAVPFVVLETGWEWRYLLPCAILDFGIIFLGVGELLRRLGRTKFLAGAG